MDFGAASLNVRSNLLPVTGVRKRAVFANKGGTTVTRPFTRRIEVTFFMEKLERGVERDG